MQAGVALVRHVLATPMMLSYLYPAVWERKPEGLMSGEQLCLALLFLIFIFEIYYLKKILISRLKSIAWLFRVPKLEKLGPLWALRYPKYTGFKMFHLHRKYRPPHKRLNRSTFVERDHN